MFQRCEGERDGFQTGRLAGQSHHQLVGNTVRRKVTANATRCFAQDNWRTFTTQGYFISGKNGGVRKTRAGQADLTCTPLGKQTSGPWASRPLGIGHVHCTPLGLVFQFEHRTG